MLNGNVEDWLTLATKKHSRKSEWVYLHPLLIKTKKKFMYKPEYTDNINMAKNMTLLDCFAAEAMSRSIDVRPAGFKNWVKWLLGREYRGCVFMPEKAAEQSYRQAAAMMEERKKYLNALQG